MSKINLTRSRYQYQLRLEPLQETLELHMLFGTCRIARSIEFKGRFEIYICKILKREKKNKQNIAQNHITCISHDLNIFQKIRSRTNHWPKFEKYNNNNPRDIHSIVLLFDCYRNWLISRHFLSLYYENIIKKTLTRKILKGILAKSGIHKE